MLAKVQELPVAPAAAQPQAEAAPRIVEIVFEGADPTSVRALVPVSVQGDEQEAPGSRVASYLVESSVGRFDLTSHRGSDGIRYHEAQASSLSPARRAIVVAISRAVRT